MNSKTRKLLNQAIAQAKSFSSVAGIPPIRKISKTTIPKAYKPAKATDRNCIACLEWLDPAYFRASKRGNGRRYLDSRCDHCRRIAAICRNHAITPTMHAKLMADSFGQCAVCRRPFDSIRAVIDHCHESGKLRGVLCAACNQALGLIREDLDVLSSAIEYLRHWHARHALEPQTEHDLRREANMSRIRDKSRKQDK